MLTNASINAAVGTVAAWQRTPYALAPKPGSLLAKLCEHTRLDSLVSLNDIDNVDTERLYRDLHYVANGIDPMQMSDTEHSVVMDGTVEFLVGSMRSYLNHARTVAGPAIDEIIQEVEESKPSWYQPPTLAQIEIWNPPEPFVGDELEKLVKPFAEEQLQPVNLIRLINERANYSAIGEMIRTGISDLDKAIDIWFGSLDKYTIEALWNTFFMGEGNGMIGQYIVAIRDGSVWEYFRNVKCGIDCALFVFLLSRRLAEARHPDSAVSLEAFDDQLMRYVHASGQALAMQIKTLNDANSTDVLVRDIIMESQTVVVFGPVYDRWLENHDNSADMLLALTLRDVRNSSPYQSTFTADEIQEMELKLKGAWVTNLSVGEYTARGHQLNEARWALYNAFAKQMDEISEVTTGRTGEELDEAYTPLRKGELTAQWRHEVDNDFNYEDIENIPAWVLKTMCKVRYHGRPTFVLLNGVNLALNSDSKLTEDEAAFMSTFRYLVLWCIGQVTPTKDWNR